MPNAKSSKPVATWLFIGVAMIMVQVLLGGITRLTESGLSITEWKPVTGILPPLDHAAWQSEFDKYRNTDQFRFIHADFSLQDFKFIFFWEWLHRFWARLLGIVFITGFVYFLVRKKFKPEMIIPMIILFLLGALQGLVGWIMVRSGLVPEKMFVGHVELATHFVAALILLCYTFWFALQLSVPSREKTFHLPLKRITILILGLLFLQLIYGAFMSGLKAATAAPTWPAINGHIIPGQLHTLTPWWKNLTDNKIMVQFIHRNIAYLITLVVICWWFISRKSTTSKLFRRTTWIPAALVATQVLLGILTVTRSPYGNELVWFGLAHQFTAMLFLLVMVWMLYLLQGSRKSIPHT